jgi:acyl-coenzyme A thioesterase PaaI-like protein
MDVTALPFSQLIGLEHAAPESGFLLSLPASPNYLNHLGTVHAGALLALAESASGAFLLGQFGPHPEFVAVVRRMETKFRKPAHGLVSARASGNSEEMTKLFDNLAAKGRTSISVNVEVVDEEGTLALSAVVEWFVAKNMQASDGTST